ncbi:uncharacterized protein LOC132257214 [Phlebotomus argentipes]|uniref:uncharacterized protein LOC132257214 n=1 Tax=Phlebotomus argentipes TaxID=94469 RepID=UPI002892E998|nr:uncharacterized protein LOC132257214 [Phlebotomus argentipes]
MAKTNLDQRDFLCTPLKRISEVISLIKIYVIFVIVILAMDLPDTAVAQAEQPLFELPVQLVGFPVIIMAVRLTNFVKKLAYSLNPQTYQSRTRRSVEHATSGSYATAAIDAVLAEKRILSEFGPKACVLEEPCRIHAWKAVPGEQPDWDDILSNYKVHNVGMRQWYLLSVFLGDVIRSPNLCKQLAKRLDCHRESREFA